MRLVLLTVALLAPFAASVAKADADDGVCADGVSELWSPAVDEPSVRVAAPAGGGEDRSDQLCSFAGDPRCAVGSSLPEETTRLGAAERSVRAVDVLLRIAPLRATVAFPSRRGPGPSDGVREGVLRPPRR